MNADYSLIGERISFYRHRVGLTKEQLAEKCNMSVSHFWELEKRIKNDKKHPGVMLDMRKSEAIWDIAILIKSQKLRVEFSLEDTARMP